MRIGHGFDVHAFGPGDHIVLGGVRIDHDRGLVAHSDGDVVLHALCDALLGGVAEGDIGKHFPDTDERYRNIDSRELLAHCYRLVQARGYLLGNADITVEAQCPRLARHMDAMCRLIAGDLQTDRSAINVKATTTEKLGYIGRQEGIACHAIVLLVPQGGV
jgi:2-C-methyl-D-erythritol 2,4-cyclodiphosphate synthase